jgi:hypothetical protein
MSPASAKLQGPTSCLIHTRTADTLVACCHVLAYLQEATHKVDVTDDQMIVGDGLRWIFTMVEQALSFESERATAVSP